ncbi:endonuclease/exonuclease/phosphatase family protein [Salinimicrobium catena]|uniref:endonuclease/exonuclease/phosphatase family protein n=1 Tax=Salinimicrobium catena TaxID=390640 RepID=UPI002FE45858
MKGLNWFDKFLFFLNSLFAAMLLFSYLLPYIPPDSFALLSVFSLGVPFLILVNIIFFLYWLFRLKRQVLLSLVVLLIGFNHLTSIYEISSSEDAGPDKEEFKVMSYNVRQFNEYGWSQDIDIPKKISTFVKEEDPHVVAMQEYFKGELDIAEGFPHKYIKLKDRSAEFGLSILSKYPIVNRGSLDFPTGSNNNAIFADVVKGNDTIRIINVHLQSFSVKPNMNKLEQENSKKVFLGMGQTFVRQQTQMEIVLRLIRRTPYKIILMGDFNNTAYSYIYRELKSEGLYDAYKEAGNGFGRTFDFRFFPLRIDFILASEGLEVLEFTTYEVQYSDHFPVSATFDLN